MSENPIFLIDLRYKNITVDPDQPAAPSIKRCYFIPDAHHAIPFIYQSGDSYVAPAWFDALMSHNGQMGTNGEWATWPTEFYVSLHRKSIKYTIEAHDEDHWSRYLNNSTVPAPVNNDPNDTRQNMQGFGIPYYGLVTKIEDRYGNRVQFNYCDPRQVWQDEGGRNYDDSSTNCCKECAQNCNAKGQINWVKLFPAN